MIHKIQQLDILNIFSKDVHFYKCTNTYQKKMYTFDKCAKLCLTE